MKNKYLPEYWNEAGSSDTAWFAAILVMVIMFTIAAVFLPIESFV